MSTPLSIPTGFIETNAPVSMDVIAGGTVPAAPPTIVDVYTDLTQQVRQLNQRIAALRPALTAFVATMPSQVMDTGDGKIRIATVTRSTSLTRRFMTAALGAMMDHQDGTTPRPPAERDALVAAAVAFIWQRRTVRTTTRLVRTWASARKRRAGDTDMND
jgi:hypothetical protein